jgi:hypothetical protein
MAHHHGMSAEDAVHFIGRFASEHESHPGYELIGTDDGGGWSGFMECRSCGDAHTLAIDNEQYQATVALTGPKAVHLYG